MSALEELLDRVEALLAEVDEFPPAQRETVLALLDELDRLHRDALGHLAGALGDRLADVRGSHPALDWLFAAYAVGVDQRAAVEQALARVRPYVEEHGGTIELLDVVDGEVRLRMAGACAGCTASAVTLQDGVDAALREDVPGYRGIQVEQPSAAAHPPPAAGPPLLQIGVRPPG